MVNHYIVPLSTEVAILGDPPFDKPGAIKMLWTYL